MINMWYAKINQNNIVENVFEWLEENCPIVEENKTLIDITNLEVKPEPSMIYNQQENVFYQPYEIYTIQQLKNIMKQKCKENAYEKIIQIYPLWKQINLIQYRAYGYTEQDYLQMVEYINNIRTICNEKEITIDSYTTKQEVMSTNINFD